MLYAPIIVSFFATHVVANFLTPEEVLSTPYISLLSPPTLSLHTRADSSTTADNQTSLLNPDGTLNTTAFSAATEKACVSALSKLTRSSNPTGLCLCYNLPSLNTGNGVFEADLRLYRVSDPRGAWVGVNSSQIDVNVGYSSARVTSVTKDKQAAGQSKARRLAARQSEPQGALPKLVQEYSLIGEISKKFPQNISMADLETLLLPSLNLTAPSASSRQNLTTTLSPNEASFLTGIFSDQTPLSSFSAAQAAVDAQLAILKAGQASANSTTEPEVAFVLPGTQILIFPFGLIITGSWALLGIGVYAFGTIERWRFRELYKQRRLALDRMGRTKSGF